MFIYIYIMIYYFVYETTNLLNGKKYRGIHKTSKIEDGYIGSGLSFKNSVKKYGKDSFKREILEFCSCYEELIEREKEYVDIHWVNNINNYNIKTGGQSVGILSQESKDKISNTPKDRYKRGEIKVRHTIETKEKLSIKAKIAYALDKNHSFKIYSDNTKFLIGNDPWNKGTSGLQEAWNKGKIMGPHSDESNKSRSESLKKRYETHEHPSKGKDPWNKGKLGVQEAWNKGRTMEKIECPHCKKMFDKFNAKRWHFDNCKFKLEVVE
jgi:hypothetical protein